MTISLMTVSCAKKTSVDTGKLESSFETSEPATRNKVDSAVADIKSSDYAGAMAALQTLAKDSKLTPEQQEAIKGVVEQLKTLIAETPHITPEAAAKVLGDMQKTAPK
jgi:type IV pilus biogenesis protein CpaD/CtpE